ncbi:MAG: S49 family peptidase [Alphaproteobacteria bacterium]|jgi:protease-4|nr:S49 family peptidase [Alphaproteobacteria bacterium]
MDAQNTKPKKGVKRIFRLKKVVKPGKREIFKKKKPFILFRPFISIFNYLMRGLRVLGNFIAAIFALIVILNIAGFIGSLLEGKETEDEMVLVVDLNKGVADSEEEFFINIDFDQPYHLSSLSKKIEIAAKDEKIKAIVFKGEDNQLGLASIEEIKNALKKYNESGKKSIYFSKTFGAGMSNGIAEYYLATSLKEIWMESNSTLNLLGIGIEKPYYKELFNKIDVKPVFSKRHEYKTGPNTYLENNATPEEMSFTKDFSKEVYDMIISEIAIKRGISVDTVSKIVDTAPLNDKEALQLKLIDKISTRIEFNEELKKLYGEDIKFKDIASYKPNLEDFGYNNTKEDKVILSINIDGIIIDGEAEDAPMGYVVSEPIVTSIYQEVKSESIDGIVVRVNSPGGSYTASNEIYKALMWAREKGIPVFVSQGDYAASGGYFISIASDKIFANKGTLTGSIGVYGGKFVGTEELWNTLGINWYRHSIGKNAGMGSVTKDFSETQKAAFERSLDLVYQDFTTKVSEARGISLKELDKLARGRVWLGKNSVRNKLVDGIADYNTVVNKMKVELGLKETDLVILKSIPDSSSEIEQLKRLIGKNMSIKSAIKEEIGIDDKSALWIENFLIGKDIKMVAEPIFIDM